MIVLSGVTVQTEKDIKAENDAKVLICAAKLRWRSISGCMGNKEFFKSIK